MRPLLVTVVTLALLSPAFADGDPPTRTVSTSGTVVTKVAPDTVIWHVTIKTQDAELVTANAEAEARLRSVLKLADDLDVDDRDVQTGQLSIRKVYHRDKQGNRGEFRWFEVTRTVRIRQTDLEDFDKFVQRLIAAKDIEAHFTMESSKFHDIRAETRIKAAVMARDKARAMAGALDAKVGKVLTISEAGPVANPWGNRYMLSNNAVNFDVGGGGGGQVDADRGTFAPGAIEVRVTVHATFELE